MLQVKPPSLQYLLSCIDYMTFKRGKGALEAESQDTRASDAVQAWQMDLDALNKDTSVFTQPLTVLLLV